MISITPKPKPGAFTFAGLLVLIAVVALLAALLLPALAKAKSRAKRINCTNNLKQVGLAFRIFSNDHDDLFPMALSTNKGGTMEFVAGGNAFRHFQAVSNELVNPKVLVCPEDNRSPETGFRNLGNANVSYFIGVEADETKPQRILSGDRNLSVNGLAVRTGLVSIKSGDEVEWTQEIHNNAGNVGLSDGSVQQTTTSALQNQLRQAGLGVTRLAVP